MTVPQESATYDAVVVGAGFAGMYMLYSLRRVGFRVRVIEAASDVGGTWFWSRYPGARCDVESLFYSYSFSEELQQEWEWTERYPAQPELLAYAQHVADRFDLRRDIQFDTRVTAAAFDEATSSWSVTTDHGEVLTASYFVAAVGCLSETLVPQFEGLDSFKGDVFHTGRWPHHDVDFSAKKVGVIGTGSSGVQAIPELADLAEHVVVFQRTPSYSIPSQNSPLDDARRNEIKSRYREIREAARHTAGGVVHPELLKQPLLETDSEQVEAELWKRWRYGGSSFMATFTDILADRAANEVAAEFVRKRIWEIVKDPETADALTPRDYPIGAKRICLDTDYFSTYNREDVTLVDVRETGIERISPQGVIAGGSEHELDVLVLATGYDAMTGALKKIDIVGKGRQRLTEAWAAGPVTYLGLSVSGFPNMFLITGPGSPSVLSNVIVSIEQHVEWITEHLLYLRELGITRSEAQPEAQAAWVEEVREAADRTLLPEAASWFVGANVPGKPRVVMPYTAGVGTYRARCDEIAADGYRGFDLVDDSEQK